MAMTKADVFARRLNDRIDELKWLYMELYNDTQAFDWFLTMLSKMYEKRSASLRRLDAQREQDPDWYKDRSTLGMLMYTQCFGGTINGVRGHLDYIEETGVNYLHLMPLLQSPAGRSDGGYAVADFRRVDPALGTMKDLSALSEECHKRNISVCLDFVMNHTS